MAGRAERARRADRVAVALRYDLSLPAPMIVAAAAGRAAERAERIAREAGVPVVSDEPLARALVPLEIGSLVPREYWEIVARTLIFIKGLPGAAG